MPDELIGLLVLAVIVVVVRHVWVEWERWRNEREEMLRIRLDAMSAAHRISLAAWETRQAMLEEIRRKTGTEP